MKELFLLNDSLIFLNHGSFGACPRAVFQDYQDWQLQMEQNPVEFLGRRSAGLLLESRKALALYLNADPRDLVYVQNATTGVNIVAQSLELRPGDEIVTTDQEYGACDNAWRFAAAARGASIVRAAIPLPFAAEEFVDRVWSQVTAATRVIAVSHITSVTALIFPIAELCRRARVAGILTLIDGAHAPGQIPLDLAQVGADFYVGNCHKWMCAPKGAAFLHARAEHQDRLNAPVISWGYSPVGTKSEAELTALTGSTPFERHMQWQGTRDIAAFLAVPAAIRFQHAHDWDTVRVRCHEMALALDDRMRRRTGLPPLFAPQDFAQMVPIAVPVAEPARLKDRLFEQFGIEVPVTTHAGHVFVRVSVQAYNSEQDLTALEAALASVYGLRA